MSTFHCPVCGVTCLGASCCTNEHCGGDRARFARAATPSEKRDTAHEARALLQKPMVQRASAQVGERATLANPVQAGAVTPELAHPTAPQGTPSAEYRVLHAQFVEMRERWQKRDAYALSLERELADATKRSQQYLTEMADVVDKNDALIAEIADLKHDIERHVAIACTEATRAEKAERELAECQAWRLGANGIKWYIDRAELAEAAYAAKNLAYETARGLQKIAEDALAAAWRDAARLEWIFSDLNDAAIAKKLRAVSDAHALGGTLRIRMGDYRAAIDDASAAKGEK